MIQDFLLLCLFLVFYWMLFRKFIISWLDPIWIMLVMLASASVLTLREFFYWADVIFFILATACLWAGFFTLKRPKIQRGDYSNAPMFQIKFLEYITYGLFFIFLLANIYAISKVGIAILSDIPSEFKSAAFSGGLGIVRRINWSINIVIGCACGFFIAIRYRTWVFALIFFALVVISVMSGAKSGVLWYLFILSFIFKKFQFGFKIPARYRRLSVVLIIVAVASALNILYIEVGSVDAAVTALARRVLMSSDIVLYYYHPAIQSQFADRNVLDFFGYEFNGITGFLRLAPYQEPIGFQMVKASLELSNQVLPANVVGPNLVFFVKAKMFLGWIAGLAYCYLLGLVISWVRKKFFESTNIAPAYFVLLFSLALNITGITIESGLVITQLFDLAYLYGFFFIAMAILTKKIPAMHFHHQSKNLAAI